MVNRGTWDNEYFQCPKCGERLVIEDGTPIDNHWRYCPYCGQLLDGIEPREPEDWEKENE